MKLKINHLSKLYGEENVLLFIPSVRLELVREHSYVLNGGRVFFSNTIGQYEVNESLCTNEFKVLSLYSFMGTFFLSQIEITLCLYSCY